LLAINVYLILWMPHIKLTHFNDRHMHLSAYQIEDFPRHDDN